MKKGLITAVLAMVVLLSVSHAFADTSFTYQGKLKDQDKNVSGTCSFQFALFDADKSGVKVGSTVTKTGVAVENGLFSAELDFGADAFNGSDRYLEISVDCGSGYVVLDPRQKITAAPYASYAATAGSVDGTTGSFTDLTIKESLKIESGDPGAGKVLTSDKSGNAAWANAPGTGDMKTSVYDKNTDSKIDSAALEEADPTVIAAVKDGVDVSEIGNKTGGYLVYKPNNTACANNQALKWDGAKWICANDTDTYNSAYDTETEIDAAVANNGYLTGESDPTVNAGVKDGVNFFELQNNTGVYMSYKPNNAACANNQVLKWDGTRWICANDTDTYNSAYDSEAEIDAAVANNGYLTGESDSTVNAAVKDGVNFSELQNNTGIYMSYKPNNAACANNQVLKWDGTRWICANDTDTYNSAYDSEAEIDAAVANNGYLTGESDPTVNAAVKDGVDVSEIGNKAGGYLAYKPNNIACADTQILKWDNATGRWICAGDIGSTDASALTTGTLADARLSSDVAHLNVAETIASDWINTANPWADNEVADNLTISGGVINNTPIGTTTQAAGAFSALRVGTSATTGNVLTADGSGNATWQAPANTTDATLLTSGTLADARLSSDVANLSVAETVTGNWVNTSNPWADNEVADNLTISGGTVNNTVIGGTTPAAGTFTTLKVTTGAGTAGQLLTSDASGNATWQAPAAVGVFERSGTVVRGSTAGGVVYSTDDFVFGSSQLADMAGTNDDTRMFFNKAKSAFRAGYAIGTEWDDANVGDFSTAMGGHTTASGLGSTAMGNSTTASGDASTAMGEQTTASGQYSTAMGNGTTASLDYSTSMGYQTNASGLASTAMGGVTITSGAYSTAMGYYTTAQSYASLVIGQYNTISGTYDSWISTDPVFVIGNGSGVGSESDAFVVYKDGSISSSTGVSLTTGGTWTNSSDRNVKENFEQVNTREILSALVNIPVETWNYKTQEESIRHIGPMSQDFYAAFKVGEDDKHITTIDADGVALAAIQGLHSIVEEQKAVIEKQQATIDDLKSRLEALEAKIR